MGKWLHRLSDIDRDKLEATCSFCGDVNIRKKGKSYRCRVALSMEKYKLPLDSDFIRPLKCEACSSSSNISYDHDHRTGLFRGWLCHRCNIALGMALDNPDTLMKLAQYLKKSSTI